MKKKIIALALVTTLVIGTNKAVYSSIKDNINRNSTINSEEVEEVETVEVEEVETAEVEEVETTEVEETEKTEVEETEKTEVEETEKTEVEETEKTEVEEMETAEVEEMETAEVEEMETAEVEEVETAEVEEMETAEVEETETAEKTEEISNTYEIKWKEIIEEEKELLIRIGFEEGTTLNLDLIDWDKLTTEEIELLKGLGINREKTEEINIIKGVSEIKLESLVQNETIYLDNIDGKKTEFILNGSNLTTPLNTNIEASDIGYPITVTIKEIDIITGSGKPAILLPAGSMLILEGKNKIKLNQGAREAVTQVSGKLTIESKTNDIDSSKSKKMNSGKREFDMDYKVDRLEVTGAPKSHYPVIGKKIPGKDTELVINGGGYDINIATSSAVIGFSGKSGAGALGVGDITIKNAEISIKSTGGALGIGYSNINRGNKVNINIIDTDLNVLMHTSYEQVGIGVSEDANINSIYLDGVRGTVKGYAGGIGAYQNSTIGYIDIRNSKLEVTAMANYLNSQSKVVAIGGGYNTTFTQISGRPSINIEDTILHTTSRENAIGMNRSGGALYGINIHNTEYDASLYWSGVAIGNGTYKSSTVGDIVISGNSKISLRSDDKDNKVGFKGVRIGSRNSTISKIKIKDESVVLIDTIGLGVGGERNSGSEIEVDKTATLYIGNGKNGFPNIDNVPNDKKGVHLKTKANIANNDLQFKRVIGDNEGASNYKYIYDELKYEYKATLPVNEGIIKNMNENFKNLYLKDMKVESKGKAEYVIDIKHPNANTGRINLEYKNFSVNPTTKDGTTHAPGSEIVVQYGETGKIKFEYEDVNEDVNNLVQVANISDNNNIIEFTSTENENEYIYKVISTEPGSEMELTSNIVNTVAFETEGTNIGVLADSGLEVEVENPIKFIIDGYEEEYIENLTREEGIVKIINVNGKYLSGTEDTAKIRKMNKAEDVIYNTPDGKLEILDIEEKNILGKSSKLEFKINYEKLTNINTPEGLLTLDNVEVTITDVATKETTVLTEEATGKYVYGYELVEGNIKEFTINVKYVVDSDKEEYVIFNGFEKTFIGNKLIKTYSGLENIKVIADNGKIIGRNDSEKEVVVEIKDTSKEIAIEKGNINIKSVKDVNEKKEAKKSIIIEVDYKDIGTITKEEGTLNLSKLKITAKDDKNNVLNTKLLSKEGSISKYEVEYNFIKEGKEKIEIEVVYDIDILFNDYIIYNTKKISSIETTYEVEDESDDEGSDGDGSDGDGSGSDGDGSDGDGSDGDGSDGSGDGSGDGSDGSGDGSDGSGDGSDGSGDGSDGSGDGSDGSGDGSDGSGDGSDGSGDGSEERVEESEESVEESEERVEESDERVEESEERVEESEERVEESDERVEESDERVEESDESKGGTNQDAEIKVEEDGTINLENIVDENSDVKVKEVIKEDGSLHYEINIEDKNKNVITYKVTEEEYNELKNLEFGGQVELLSGRVPVGLEYNKEETGISTGKIVAGLVGGVGLGTLFFFILGKRRKEEKKRKS